MLKFHTVLHSRQFYTCLWQQKRAFAIKPSYNQQHRQRTAVREDVMSIRVVFVMLVAVVSMTFGFMPANAQQARRAQPPQSLRLYVLDCGKITPANADA